MMQSLNFLTLTALSPFLTGFFILFFLFLLLILITFFFLNLAFRRRQNNHPYLRYFNAKDFPHLEADEVEFRSRLGHILRGAFYYEEVKQPAPALIVFPHGIGAGHHAYMHLIEQFTQQGYLVFSYDNTGCELSEGKSIRGIPQAIIDLDDAMAYLDQTTYANRPRYVVGHSWGAYAALRAPFLSKRVQKVVAIAPFDDVGELLGKYLPLMKGLKFFIRLVHRLQFAHPYASQPSRYFLKKTKAKTLVIAGERDDDIPLKGNYTRFVEASRTNSLVTVDLAKNHRHNPYLTKASEDYVIDTILKGTQEMAVNQDQTQRQAFFESIDYSHIAQHDDVIMNRIFDFLRK